MSSALEIAAIGLQAQQRALDSIANNISNVNTPAFKRSDMRFAEIVAAQGAHGAAASRFDGLAGVETATSPMLDRPGQIEGTGNWRDLAIEGGGFVELMGSAGRTLLWRGGSLRVLDDGMLATAGGVPLKAAIQVPADASELRIDRSGTVFAVMPEPLSEVELGAITLVRLADSAQIDRFDGGVYALAEDAQVTEAPAGEEGLGHFVQASLERSNVDLNSEMVALMISQRAYAANAQVVRAADELFGIANNLRR